MSYLVIGVFPNQVEVDKVLSKLESAGYYDYSISHSEKEILNDVDIEKKNGFWNWLFDDNHLDRARFEYASIDQYDNRSSENGTGRPHRKRYS